MEDTRLVAARALLAVDRADDALRQVRRVLAEEPAHAEAWCLLAMCHRRSGDIGSALAAAERGVALDPESEWAHRVHAEMLRKAGRGRDSVAAARRAVARAPEEWRTQVTLVHALLDAGSPALAKEPMTQALRLAPDVPDAYVLAGRVHARLDEPELARDCWERALALDPSNTAAQTLLARDALARGRTAEGVAGLRAALSQDPTDPTVPATVARIRAELVWRAVRWSALLCGVLLAALLTLSGLGSPLRGWLTPVALLVAVGGQAALLRGYPDGWRALARDYRNRIGSPGRLGEVIRVGVLCLGLHLLAVGWAGLAPAPLQPSVPTLLVAVPLALGWVAPLVWLLDQTGRPAVRALRRLTRRT